MLIVMAIIAILVGLLLPTLGAVRENARKKATRTLVDGIVAGLERYFTEFDEYPPSNTDQPNAMGDPIEAGSLYKYLCGQDGKGIVKVSGAAPNVRVQRMDPLISPPIENLKKNGSETIIVDSWGKPIGYLNCRFYTQAQKVSNPAYVPDDICKNPNTFDLYSTGPDKTLDSDPPNTSLKQPNDITNWTYTKK